ncbi:MAG: four helix bundle protein [Bacteroidales bacterium]|nr:four helix bundle protein [Bacteroidales bacterium]MCF8397184.1 four helix bundle protein [Bacteroidales bacterium]
MSKLTDVDAETSETTVWLDFARDCNYLDEKLYNDFTKKYEEIGKMIAGMIDNYEKFCS